MATAQPTSGHARQPGQRRPASAASERGIVNSSRACSAQTLADHGKPEEGLAGPCSCKTQALGRTSGGQREARRQRLGPLSACWPEAEERRGASANTGHPNWEEHLARCRVAYTQGLQESCHCVCVGLAGTECGAPAAHSRSGDFRYSARPVLSRAGSPVQKWKQDAPGEPRTEGGLPRTVARSRREPALSAAGRRARTSSAPLSSSRPQSCPRRPRRRRCSRRP